MMIFLAALNAAVAAWNGWAYAEYGSVLNLIGMTVSTVFSLFAFIVAVTE